jgi:hypothetical protein
MRQCSKCKQYLQSHKFLKRKLGQNKNICKKCNNEYNKKRRKSKPASYNLNTHLKSNYGITVEQYKEILKLQNDVCAICYKICNTFTRLSVDHNHNTGKVRGLLCSDCNRALGFFKENADILESAIRYLKERE